jgi:hypothetical protein
MASTLLTAGILLGLVFLFIFLFSLLHKKGKRKLLVTRHATFDALVSIHQLTINEREEFNHYYIAIDTSNLKLLYVNFSNTKEDVKIVDLQKITAVKVDLEEKSIYENRKGKPVLIEKEIVNLQLAITKKDADQTTEILRFYRYEDGMADHALLKNKVEYWKNKIANFISV